MRKLIAEFAVLVLIAASCTLFGDPEELRPVLRGPTPPPLAAPGGLSVTAGYEKLTLQWNKVDDAEYYEVYCSQDEIPPAEPEDTVTGRTAVLSKDLKNKEHYNIWVKAFNSTGSSDFSSPVRGIPWDFLSDEPEKPGKPRIIPGFNQLSVSWEENGGAQYYEVYVNVSDTIPLAYELIAYNNNTILRGLENDQIYYVWIRAGNDAGISEYSDPQSGIPNMPAAAPAAPEKPVLAEGNKKLYVTWQAVEMAEVYYVYYKETNAPGQPLQYNSKFTDTVAVVEGLQNNVSYSVWIKAENIIDESELSQPEKATPSAFAEAPETPAVPTVEIGSESLTINWVEVEGALSYELWAGLTDDPAAADKYDVDGSKTSFNLTGLDNGVTYFIWIKAKNDMGESDLSTVASGTPMAAPDAPLLIPSPTQMRVSWTAVPGAHEYEVYYGVVSATTLWIATTETTATITGLVNGTTYQVRIRAMYSIGVSADGPSASETTGRIAGLYKGEEYIDNHNLAASLDYVSLNAANGDDYYIVLGANEDSAGTTLGYSGKTVGITLLGFGMERTISLSAAGSLFTVNDGVTLTLDKNITLNGINTNDGVGNNGSAIVTLDGAGSALIMNEGSKLSGNYNSFSGYGGGAVSVSDGTFTMKGGEISGNRAPNGGGVYVNGTNASFSMESGKITGNVAYGINTSYGGGVCVTSGTFTMEGGEISENTVTCVSTNNRSRGGGLYVNGTFIMDGGEISGNSASTNNPQSGRGDGGGVYVDGTFIMNRGDILENTASLVQAGSGNGSGVYVDGIFTMEGGTISGNYRTNHGGGVYVIGTFTMKHGEISDNRASHQNSSSSGGGVYVSGSFTMEGGEISRNSTGIINRPAGIGGGVCVNGTFAMDGGEISGNNASDVGGGVYMSGTSGAFTMEGGEISGNTAEYGGGVYIVDGGTFTMEGGTVYGNEASGAPAGLANTANTEGAALYKESSGSATYGDGTDILPHPDDWQTDYTDYTIEGRK